MKMKKSISAALIFGILVGGIFSLTSSASDFVKIKNGHFERNGKPYLFVGANFWQGMNLGAGNVFGNRELLIRELDHMKSVGISQLRVLALSEGPWNEPYRIIPAVLNAPGEMDENVLQGLDFLLDEMKKRDMTAVLCLSNFWPWSGGFAQWVSWFEGASIPYPPPHPGGSWDVFQSYSSRFYLIPQAIRAQQEAVKKIINRTNSISGIFYHQDPTIMAWELANEPRGGTHRPEFLNWISSSAKWIKSLDSHHLITIGSEGETLNPTGAGNHFVEDHSIPEIDYATIHIWVENWGVYQPLDPLTFPNAVNTMKSYIADHLQKAKSFGKPIVLEEFGMARDQRSMNPESTTVYRDQYYDLTFKEVFSIMGQGGAITGINFWAWSGENRPAKPFGGLWKLGDPFVGDPPHEEQGWYGIYNTDQSTLAVVKKYADQISGIHFGE